MGQHAKLSPSSAERWIECPASVRMSEGYPDDPSAEAEEGTTAHALAELKARHILIGAITAEEYATARADLDLPEGDALAEMEQYTDSYVECLGELIKMYPGSRLMLEQRVQTGIDRCWGTADAIIVSPEVVHVVDLKYGKGVWVSCVENPQLKLYALGAMELFADVFTVDTLAVTVFQPRLNNVDTVYIEPGALQVWRDSIKPIAEMALSPAAPFGPSEAACRWCPAAGSCRERMAYVTELDFGTDPDALSPEELADALDRLAGIRSWCSAIEAEALRRLYSQGQKIPGYKSVLRGGRRYVVDATAAIQTLIDAGFPAEEVAEFKIKTFGHLEKLVGGRKTFDSLVGRYVAKSEPSPAVVRESEPGVPTNRINEAMEEFSEDQGTEEG